MDEYCYPQFYNWEDSEELSMFLGWLLFELAGYEETAARFSFTVSDVAGSLNKGDLVFDKETIFRCMNQLVAVSFEFEDFYGGGVLSYFEDKAETPDILTVTLNDNSAIIMRGFLTVLIASKIGVHVQKPLELSPFKTEEMKKAGLEIIAPMEEK
jgi:hypothetical protein